MTSGSFQSRRLRLTLTLPRAVFRGTGSNTLTLTDLRMAARLEGSGNLTNSLNIDVFGMAQADMNSVTTLFGQSTDKSAVVTNAIVKLEALNGTAWVTLFTGGVIEAYPNYASMPDVSMSIMAQTGFGAQITPSIPTSFRGSITYSALAAQLAGSLGFAFENNGVTGAAISPYLPGSLIFQLRALADQGKFDYYLTAQGGVTSGGAAAETTLVICPRGQGRVGKLTALLTPQSGLVGYPQPQKFGLAVTALFSPLFELGAPLLIQGSTIPLAEGTWFPYHYEHTLDSLKPNGQWFTRMDCLRYDTTGAA